MNISNNVNYAKASGGAVKTYTKGHEKDKWKLTEPLKEKIVELAKKDAKSNIYMGKEFMALRRSEVNKAAPDRAALIAKFSQSAGYNSVDNMKRIQEADEKRLCILFGIPYKAEFQGEGGGSAVHVYNDKGEEALTYTQGVGWHAKETKAETRVHSALKSVYYEAFTDARKSLDMEANTEAANENIVGQRKFDTKA